MLLTRLCWSQHVKASRARRELCIHGWNKTKACNKKKEQFVFTPETTDEKTTPNPYSWSLNSGPLSSLWGGRGQAEQLPDLAAVFGHDKSVILLCSKPARFDMLIISNIWCHPKDNESLLRPVPSFNTLTGNICSRVMIMLKNFSFTSSKLQLVSKLTSTMILVWDCVLSS